MNQDNNFNIHGNNEMSNNQSLNNKNFNQGININQQPTNSQLQSTPSFQQQIIQTPILQPTNTFESDNIDSKNPNSKQPKRINLGLIIGIVTAVAIVTVGIVFGSKLLSSGGKNINSDNMNAVNNIKKGTAKLIATSDNRFNFVANDNAYNYFSTYESRGPTIILDKKGNELLRANDPGYLGDTYFLIWGDENNNNRDYVKIYDANKKKNVYQFAVRGGYWLQYKNGILYYNGNNDVTTAYDLINQKQLWSKNDVIVSDVTNDYIFMYSKNYSSKLEYSQDSYPSVVLDLNGNVIIEGNTDEYKNYNSEKNNLVHTFIISDKYYLKVKFKKYIEVYDYNNKLISTISLESSGTTNYYISKIFDNGLFSVREINKDGNDKYILYDVNKNILFESDSIIDYVDHDKETITSSEVLVLESSSNYYIIKDNVVVEKIDDIKYKTCRGDFCGENTYLLIKNYDTVNSKYNNQFLNLKTLKKFDIPLDKINDSFEESLNGEQIILTNKDGSYVYNSNFELKYKSSNMLDSINNKYVLEYTSDGKTYVVNIESGKKNEIEIKGKFDYSLSSCGFVTSDGTNYYLYMFN